MSEVTVVCVKICTSPVKCGCSTELIQDRAGQPGGSDRMSNLLLFGVLVCKVLLLLS